MVEVKLWGSLRDTIGDQGSVNVEAKNIRELFRKLAQEYPGLEPHLKKGISVAIDGVIYRDDWSKQLPEGAEIFLMRRMAGG